MEPNKIVTLTTDFGQTGGYAGTVKGVLLKINPYLTVVEVTQEITCFDVLEGALVLSSFYRFFPRGTIHLAVVDPGVGGKRKGILIRTDDYFFVGPDNGIFSFVYEQEKVREMVNLTSSKYFMIRHSSTFHARDVFAPVSAYLSLGVKPGEFGSTAKDCYKFELPQPVYGKDYIRGEIIYIDRFGNLITNISSNLIPDENKVQVKFRNKKIGHLNQYYEEEKKGKLLALIGSDNFLEIAVNQGSAQRILKAETGDKIKVEKI
jgi:S-adenosylmethionine hydrolase